MSIFPLQQFETDVKEYEEAKRREDAVKPETVVVRYGRMRQIGEYTYKGDVRPGCGSKMVVRTHRGTELGELLTSTCPNAGCGKSVTRQEMLEYIENSGGRDYPFRDDGRAVRLATPQDMKTQQDLDATIPDLVRSTRQIVKELGLEMKIVDADPILGGERLTFYFMAEDRVDFRDLVKRLADEHRTRIEMRQIGARDEARLTADYERCGQHCCCKSFLKVLKPVSIKSAKQQKATLDPLKISGRCGRLMCCLRYEDETYKDLKKRLPHRKSRVGTPEGAGIVIETQILTQLALVELEHNQQRIAVPVEELMDPEAAPKPKPPEPAPRRAPRSKAKPKEGDPPRRSRRRPKARPAGDAPNPPANESPKDAEGAPKKKRRRGRRRGRGRGPSEGGGGGGDAPTSGD